MEQLLTKCIPLSPLERRSGYEILMSFVGRGLGRVVIRFVCLFIRATFLSPFTGRKCPLFGTRMSAFRWGKGDNFVALCTLVFLA